ncbi:MAG: hypothetical protein K6A68_13800 [Clostridiales bacterium]|nr:hypothetical protein [Clostridiales bacterium]
MKSVSIFLADTDADGAVLINSPSSHFTAARIPKEELDLYENSISMPGVYMLLIGSDTVYVGQSGLDTIKNRIVNTHSGNIDSSWHTVLGFCCVDKTIGNNELLFLENALCEYVHNNFTHCATTTPTKKNCNAKFRNSHYHLGAGAILNCNQYFHDIIDYLKMFPHLFPGQSMIGKGTGEAQAELEEQETALFYANNPKRDAHGQAEIIIHTGNKGKRKAILKAGSQISTMVSDKFKSYKSVIARREELEKEGKLKDRILKADVVFPSQSSAGEFLFGTSCNGNTTWKSTDGKLLTEYLE